MNTAIITKRITTYEGETVLNATVKYIKENELGLTEEKFLPIVFSFDETETDENIISAVFDNLIKRNLIISISDISFNL